MAGRYTIAELGAGRKKQEPGIYDQFTDQEVGEAMLEAQPGVYDTLLASAPDTTAGAVEPGFDPLDFATPALGIGGGMAGARLGMKRGIAIGKRALPRGGIERVMAKIGMAVNKRIPAMIGAGIGGAAGGALQGGSDPTAHLLNAVMGGVTQPAMELGSIPIAALADKIGVSIMKAGLTSNPEVAKTFIEKFVGNDWGGRQKIKRIYEDLAGDSRFIARRSGVTIRGDEVMKELRRRVLTHGTDYSDPLRKMFIGKSRIDAFKALEAEMATRTPLDIPAELAQINAINARKIAAPMYAKGMKLNPMDPASAQVLFHKHLGEILGEKLHSKIPELAAVDEMLNRVLTAKNMMPSALRGGRPDPMAWQMIATRAGASLAGGAYGASQGADLPERARNFALGATGGYALTSPRSQLIAARLMYNPVVREFLARIPTRAAGLALPTWPSGEPITPVSP